MLLRPLYPCTSWLLGSLALCSIMGANVVWGQDRQQELEALKRQVEELRQRDMETRRQLEFLQQRLESLQAQPVAPAPVPSPSSSADLDREVQALAQQAPPSGASPSSVPALLSRPVGTANLRLVDLSADILFALGGSTENRAALELLQAGGHDPRNNGFTFQQLELSLIGALDPYFTGEAHALFVVDNEGETVIELEEAFMTTQALPFGLQVEGGFFYTEFGLINPVHPHAWEWVDIPIVNARFFGSDGLRQAGLRLGWLIPLPWFSELHLGVQNPHGETTVSFLANDEVFEERPIGGRPFTERVVEGPEDMLYLLRWVNGGDLTPTLRARVGVSALFGPNATGPDGRTIIHGADLKVTWRPLRHFRGWPFLHWQTEFTRRLYTADAFTGTEEEDGEEPATLTLPRQTFDDWGLYSQLLYGFTYRWAVGLRGEYVTGHGDSIGGRNADPFRDDRYRLSPLLAWYASEFTRIRLQYNYDHAEHLPNKDAHALWLVFEGSYGAHPAHRY